MGGASVTGLNARELLKMIDQSPDVPSRNPYAVSVILSKTSQLLHEPCLNLFFMFFHSFPTFCFYAAQNLCCVRQFSYMLRDDPSCLSHAHTEVFRKKGIHLF